MFSVSCKKEHILSQLREKAYIYTNHGHKRLADVPIHFGKIIGNSFDMSKLVSGTRMKWFEIDISYLKHPVCKSLRKGSQKWKKFLCKLGVSDFVRIVEVKKGVWDSQELTHLLSHVSSNGDKEKSKYLLRVLNQLWDSNFGNKPFTSYVINILNGVQWLVSDKDTQLHFPKDLFRDSELVRDILSDTVPYAVPKVNNVKFVNDIGLKNITLDDALSLLDSDQSMTHRSLSNRLCDVYPGLYDFFVNELGVAENPPLRIYLPSLIQCLSTGSLPSQAAIKPVFQVFQKWSADLDSGGLSYDDIDYLKKCMEEKEMKILPTMQDEWVSLHQSFGLVCWCDDEQLGNQYKNLNNVHFISFGELTTQEKQIFQDKVSVLFRILGIPYLSEVVTRDVICDGLMDSNSKASLINSVLPYAQRYIYSVHPNVYAVLKDLW
nr:histidine kinase-, DNA gyrase B-, and HSP90-like ATPase family protein [Tanacetum cinerariifolium]